MDVDVREWDGPAVLPPCERERLRDPNAEGCLVKLENDKTHIILGVLARHPGIAAHNRPSSIVAGISIERRIRGRYRRDFVATRGLGISGLAWRLYS